MNRKLPIRTYQRKNATNPSVNLYQPSFLNPTNKDCVPSAITLATDTKDELDKSLDYDPFETTFDRIAKNARLPIPPIDTCQNKSCLSSSSDISKNLSTEDIPQIRVSVNLSNVSVEPVRKVKRGRKKEPPMQVIRRKVRKEIKSDSRDAQKSFRKNMSYKNTSAKIPFKVKQKRTYMQRTVRKKKRQKFNDSKSISLFSNSTSSVTENNKSSKNNVVESPRKYTIEKENSSKSTKQNDIAVLNLAGSFNNMSIKTCSVILDSRPLQSLGITPNDFVNPTVNNHAAQKGLDIMHKNNKITLRKIEKITNDNLQYNGISDIMRDCSVRLEKLQAASRNEEYSNNNLLYNSILDLKPCFIKLDRLEEVSNARNINSNDLQYNDATDERLSPVKLDRSEAISNIKEPSGNNLQNDNKLSVKSCSIKLERLKIMHKTSTSTKLEDNATLDKQDCFVRLNKLGTLTKNGSPISRKMIQKVFVSSTPINKLTRLPKYAISFSPIPLHCINKIDVPDIHSNSISIEEINEDLPPSSPKKQNDNSYCDTLENKSRSKARSPSCITRKLSVMNLSKSDSDISSIKVQNEVQSLSNENCKLPNDRQPTESSDNNDESHIHKMNVLTRCTDSPDDFIETSRTKESGANTNKAVKKQLKFLNISIDSNRSHSLFDNTTKSNEDVTNDIVKPSFTNLTCVSENVQDTGMEEKRNEMSVSLSIASHDSTRLDSKTDEAIMAHEKADLSGSDSKNIEVSLERNDTDCNTNEPYVLLTRLQDSFRITNTRKRYRKWDLELIYEDSVVTDYKSSENKLSSKEETEGEGKESDTKKQRFSESVDIENGTVSQIRKSIYLKPGKSWARSLSILNNIQDEFNLDELSVGKGKKWRHSVKDVLNMQKQGLVQSCIKPNKNDEVPRASTKIINKSQCVLNNNSFGRLSRRVSIRVVPNCKTVKCIEDAPFLEAYGIVPVERHRSTLICPRKTSLQKRSNNDCLDGILRSRVTLTAKEVVLQRCMQDDYIPISEYFSDSYLEHCRKIGEGVYGEVFLYENGVDKSVIKVIPIEGDELVNGEPQKKFHEILSEIVIAKELHNLRLHTIHNTNGFVEVKNIKCIIGKYPEKLVELWNIYDEEKNSENDCPSTFSENQLYIILELSHGGQDLEAFVFHTAEEAYALFAQTAFALAVAEKAMEFEHRDLHWGNILISRTDEPYMHYKLEGKDVKLVTKGVQVSIIDFTLSRMSYQGCCIFNDLASDPALFTAQGDYQFEIYRLMKEKTENDWQKFEPYTNILWLHYTLDKMITAARYKKRTLKIHKNAILKLEELKKELLHYNSTYDFVINCDKIRNA